MAAELESCHFPLGTPGRLFTENDDATVGMQESLLYRKVHAFYRRFLRRLPSCRGRDARVIALQRRARFLPSMKPGRYEVGDGVQVLAKHADAVPAGNRVVTHTRIT